MNFLVNLEVDFRCYFYWCSQSILEICPRNLENISFNCLAITEKPVLDSYLIKHEVEFQSLLLSVFSNVKPKNMPSKFWKYFNWFSNYEQKKKKFLTAILNFNDETRSWTSKIIITRIRQYLTKTYVVKILNCLNWFLNY